MKEPTEVKSGLKVDLETANKWFEDWCEAMDIDAECDDEDDIKDFDKIKKKIVRGIMEGHVMFNDDNELQYTPHRPNSRCKGEQITFHERSGASMMAADSKKAGKDMAKMYAVLSDLTKRSAQDFAGMVGSDIKMCESIFVLLMV